MNSIDGFLRASLGTLHVPAPFEGAHSMAFDWLRFFADWLPIFIFLGLLLYFMFALRKPRGWQRQYVEGTEKYQAEHLVELRRLNASLERIADVLQKRSESHD